jgi:thimet oligopeptidase
MSMNLTMSRSSAQPFGCLAFVFVAGATLSCATAQPVVDSKGTAGQPTADRSPTMRAVKRTPVPLIDHKVAPEKIEPAARAAAAACDEKLAKVAALGDGERTFQNTVNALEQAVITYLDAVQRLGILKDVHPDKAVREKAAAAEENAGKYLVKLSARRDLYKAVRGYAENAGKTETLDPQERRLVDLTLRDFKRSGLELPDDKLAELVKLRTRLTTLSTEFGKNLNENTDSIEITTAELDGLPGALVERLAKGKKDGTFVVTTKYPDVFPFMENAKNSDARKRLFVAFQSRDWQKNLPLLKEALSLRDQAAHLLGYETHADYVTEDRMARNAKNVREFLGSLRAKLKARRDADFAKMAQMKRAETKDESAKIEPWDVAYYLNQVKKRDYTLDTEKIREYFPVQTVMAGMYRVYETLLGIELKEVVGAEVWADGVKLYEIRDRASGELLSYYYADLHPRPGKYGHAACAGIGVGRETDAGYLTPIAVLMANFTPPSADRPSLLSHEEVRTLFHEFGHVMHNTLTAARFGSQSGTSVAQDFVEAPSQMLENWVFQPEVLNLLSGHFKDPLKKLPAETIAKIKEARMYDAGYRYTRQVFLASFDFTLHTSGPVVDPDAVDRELYQDILGLSSAPGTHFGATFGHLMGGYDAGYYGYLWSEVFAADMFTRFEKEGVLSPEVGRQYRDIILAKGKSAEPDVLLQEFLGRPPNNAAFLGKLGVQ